MFDNDLEDDRSVQSGLSLGSLGSLDSSMLSVASASTVFLSEPPGIPHVDAFIKNPAMRYENIKVRKQRRAKASAQELPLGAESNTLRRTAMHMNRKDFLNLFNYIDACGDFNGLITMNELDLAFAKYRYAALHFSEEDEARRLMVELEQTIIAAKLTPISWFDRFHTGKKEGGGGHPQNSGHAHSHSNNLYNSKGPEDVAQSHKHRGDAPEVDYSNTWMTHHDLDHGIAKLRVGLFMPPWRQKEVDIVLRYMDPSADGQLSMEEVARAFHRLHMPAETHFIMEMAGDILSVLDTYVTERRMRIRDLFEMFMAEGDTPGMQSKREITKKGLHKALKKFFTSNSGREAVQHDAEMHKKGGGGISFDCSRDDDDISMGSMGSLGSLGSTKPKPRGRGRGGKMYSIPSSIGGDSSVVSSSSSVSGRRMRQRRPNTQAKVVLPTLSNHRDLMRKVATEARTLSDERYLFRTASYPATGRSVVVPGTKTKRPRPRPMGNGSGSSVSGSISSSHAPTNLELLHSVNKDSTLGRNPKFARFLNDHSKQFNARFTQLDKTLDKALARLAHF